MSPYVTYKDTDKKGNLQFYILQRDFPHYVGYLSYFPVEGALAQIPISGHNIWVVFGGTLRGNYVPSYSDVILQIEITMQFMATWFYENRILPDQKRYKKWLIPIS